jgi:hypothetical protein
MNRSAEAAARQAKIAELKRLITAGKFETTEKLEEAVDAFLWSEQDRVQAAVDQEVSQLVRAHPK